MSKINIKSMEHPVVYEIFGFYVDWKIDNNLFLPGTDPHGISSYHDFLAKEKFQIVEIANKC